MTEDQKHAIEWAIGMASQNNIHKPALRELLQAARATPADHGVPVAGKDKWVAKVRVSHEGYSMELSKYIAYALPEGIHELYAKPQAPQPEAQSVRDAALDSSRLDYLDKRNARKNEQYGTKYGWQLNENHNRIALEDHAWPGASVRAAIDQAMKETPL